MKMDCSGLNLFFADHYPNSVPYVGAYLIEDGKTTEILRTNKPKLGALPVPVAKVPKNTSSKRYKALQLYDDAVDKSRKAILELFQKELNMTEVNASNYYYYVKG